MFCLALYFGIIIIFKRRKMELKEKKVSSEIEELDPTKEIAKKLAPKRAEVSTEKTELGNSESAVEEKKREYKDTVKKVAAVKEESVKPIEKAGVSVVPNAKNISLEDFESAVKKLKSMLDNGVISESEFAIEKKKLFKLLY